MSFCALIRCYNWWQLRRNYIILASVSQSMKRGWTVWLVRSVWGQNSSPSQKWPQENHSAWLRPLASLHKEKAFLTRKGKRGWSCCVRSVSVSVCLNGIYYLLFHVLWCCVISYSAMLNLSASVFGQNSSFYITVMISIIVRATITT